MENNVFFDANGITTTSANHISNLAKESYMSIEKELSQIRFYTTKASLIDSNEEKVLRVGTENIDWIPEKLEEVARLKSLIAWFREAIKEKERLVREAKNKDSFETARELGIEVPEKPVREPYPSWDDMVAEWNIKTRNRYFWLDTQCSTIGKYIHPDGYLAVAREIFSDTIQNPCKLNGAGRDAILYTSEPTVSPESVDELYFSLQDKYRSYQAELNSMKHDIETKINTETSRIDSEYVKAMEEYNAAIREIMAKAQKYHNERLEETQSLKIAIPDNLKDTYKKLSELGKKK